MDIAFDFATFGDFYFIGGPYFSENPAFTHHHFRGNGGGDGGCFFYKNRLGYNFALELCQNLYFSGVNNFFPSSRILI